MRTSDWSSDVCSSDLIPDAETALPKSVKAVSGNPGEVERGRTKAADARNLGRNGVKDLFELPEIAMTQERNAGRKQRLRHIATRGDAEATILEPGDRKSTRLNSSH